MKTALLAMLIWSGAAGAAPAQDAASRIRAVVEAEAADGFSGAVLVEQSGRVLVDGVFGTSRGEPLPPAGRFLIASAAKQFTSAALAKLQDMGRLHLDDSIARHLRDVPADKRAITIRHLLSHTSGLPQGYASEQAANRSEAEHAILGAALTAAPGGKFQYSNENYQLGVAIVEAASGRRYPDFVREELLDPAGMPDTGQLTDRASIDRLSPLDRNLPPRLSNLRWGGFGYFTTARDFHRWYRALRSGRLLEAGTTEALFAPVATIGEGHAALGWFLGRTPGGDATVFTRGNDDVGSSAVLYAYPGRDAVIVVLSHAGQKTDDFSWARAVHARIEEILIGPQGQ